MKSENNERKQNQEQPDLLCRLKTYAKTDMYPFHMPGHKRMELPDGEIFPDPYTVDITEIDAFDNLHRPEGILRESMDWAASVYGSKKSYYLVNGSTCGILSAIYASTTCGGKILIARNCHKSAYNGVILNRLEPVYAQPTGLEDFGISGGVAPDEIERILLEDERQERRIQAVLLVSPTYEGIVSDIKTIAKNVHARGIPLIVDEAHGAHLSFAKKNGNFPLSALEQGADLVIQSLHKTLPSLTQTAILHAQGNYVNYETLERYLAMFQSSSPSYVLTASIERCIRYMDGPGREEMGRYEKRLERVFETLGDMKNLRVLDRSAALNGAAYGLDPSKIVVSTKVAAGCTGERLAKMLREKYHLEMEMSGPEHIVAMTSLMDTEEGLTRLAEALAAIDRELERKEGLAAGTVLQSGGAPTPTEKLVLSPAEALERRSRRVALSDSAGRISMEFLYLYPPGIPFLAPGEMITPTLLETVAAYRRMKLPVQGLSDPTLSTILTVAEDEGTETCGGEDCRLSKKI